MESWHSLNACHFRTPCGTFKLFFLYSSLFSTPANKLWSKHVHLPIKCWKNNRMYCIILMMYLITCHSKNFLLEMNVLLVYWFSELIRLMTVQRCAQQGSEWRLKFRHEKSESYWVMWLWNISSNNFCPQPLRSSLQGGRNNINVLYRWGIFWYSVQVSSSRRIKPQCLNMYTYLLYKWEKRWAWKYSHHVLLSAQWKDCDIKPLEIKCHMKSCVSLYRHAVCGKK